MFEAPDSPFLVPFDGSFLVGGSDTSPRPDAGPRGEFKQRLNQNIEGLTDLQRRLYADNRYSVLLVFQAMDAAGKDGTIRAVMSGVNPAGCQVFSFKQPSREELDHDFLWRTSRSLPERGRIGIFNRSYYEEVLVVRVHPEYLGAQRLPRLVDLEDRWQERFESIADHEKHLARNGTIILKFWLNVSREEQRSRFLSRLNEPEKHWKFAVGDVKERGHWDEYMHAYQEVLNATSRSWAPWYAIPADDKRYMRMTVAELIVDALDGLGLAYPTVGPETTAMFDEMRSLLASEGP